MIVPGSNLLSLALTVIGSSTVVYFKYSGKSQNAIGEDVSTYLPGETVSKGSMQPVPRNRYEMYGLDWSKSYWTWFVPNVFASTITRNPDGDGDIVEYNGRRYQIISDTPWSSVDSWTYVTCCDIGPATGALTNA